MAVFCVIISPCQEALSKSSIEAQNFSALMACLGGQQTAVTNSSNFGRLYNEFVIS